MRREESRWWRDGYTKEWFTALEPHHKFKFLETLSERDLEDFHKDWRVWGRDKQLAPDGEWSEWLLICGRGFGKTLTAVKTILDWVEKNQAQRIAIVGQGEGDIRSVMIEGVSGFIKQSPSWNKPVLRPSVGVGELHWPNGAIGQIFSAEDPESLRGPEFDAGWYDEPMASAAKKRDTAYSNLMYGMRLGMHPRLIITTTPKPQRWLKDKIAEAKREAHLPVEERTIVLTHGTTFENEENLAASFLRTIRKNDGTRLGRQEIYAEILSEEEGALWTPEMLDRQRMVGVPTDERDRQEYVRAFAATMERIIVGCDPNMTEGKTAHAAGIVVCGQRAGKKYVLDDRSLVGVSPLKWARQIMNAVIDFDADEICAETNQGGALIKAVVQQAAADMEVAMPKYHGVHTKKGKERRAEPASTAYERREVWHVGHKGSEQAPGPFYKLEEQMEGLHEGHDTTGEDFDRVDGLVYALTRLGLKKSSIIGASTGSAGMMSFGDFLNGTTLQ